MKKLYQLGLFVLMSALVVSCNSKNEEKHADHKYQESIYYSCSMDPQIKEDKPGKCPICHMELTPMTKDNGAYNEITLSEQQIKLGNITTEKSIASEQASQENFTGILTLNQSNVKSISARATGRIEKLYFKTEGASIKKGQAVYQIYSEDIAIAKQDYLSAYKQMEIPGDFGKNARSMMQAAKQKLSFYGLSNAQIEAIKKSGQVSPYTTFYSGYSGTVAEITATEGSYIMEGTPLLKVGNLGNLWLETQVNVNYAKQLRVGQSAMISFVDFPAKDVIAKVSFINPEINASSRLLLIQMEVPNTSFALKPGMQAIVKLTKANTKGVFIPVDAVIRDQNGNSIWVEKKIGVFHNVKVDLGAESNGMVEITSALDPETKIVITGAYAVNSEFEFRKGKDPMAGMKM